MVVVVQRGVARGWEAEAGKAEICNTVAMLRREEGIAASHHHTQALCTPCLSLSIQAVNSPRRAAESTRKLVELTMG